MSDTSAAHLPVLLEPVKTLLKVSPGAFILDVTVGLGGHAQALGEAAGAGGLLLGVDVDPGNLEAARERLADCPATVRLFRANFAESEDVLRTAGVEKVDVILADLGVSTNQLADPQRGLSFASSGALDMRLDDRLKRTASDLVNGLKESELSDVIYFNSQERLSRRIAKRICEVRRQHRITTTDELAAVVAEAVGVDPQSRRSKIHPATRTFMALRIAVNDELGSLRALLERAPRLLKPGGRIGVISFHSVEDGEVKRDFARRKQDGVYQILTKRPVVADPAEREANPQSRSAKLRVAERTEVM